MRGVAAHEKIVMGWLSQERLEGDAGRRSGHVRLCAAPGQAGKKHEQTKPLKGFGSAGVLEVVEDSGGGTFRAVYTVKFGDAVYVLHCFQKKSTHGIATPKPDMDLIRERLKAAEAHAKKGETK